LRELVRELIETVLLALAIFLALQFSVQNFRVEGTSMRSTLEDGQYLLVNKIVYLRIDWKAIARLLPFVDDDEERNENYFAFHQPSRGEVIIFHFPRDPSRDFVKRVIGVPGDTVEIRRGQVYVNGIALDEPYIARRDSRTVAETRVGPDSYYVLGDNRGVSQDSRDWGPVPSENIVGRAWVSYWPLENFRILGALTRPLGLLSNR
jgi:signal peptidase I